MLFRLSKFLVILLIIFSNNIIFSKEAITCFTPIQTCRSKLIEFIKNTDNELKVAVFTLTNSDIAKALIDAKKRNVKIRIILDDRMSIGVGSKLKILRDNGIEIKTDKSNQYMHHKYVISDNTKLLNGSYNFSNNSEKNWENFNITNDKELVDQYSRNFEILWNSF